MSFEQSHQNFNTSLAIECANAFYASTNVACTVSDLYGNIMYEAGKGYSSFNLCKNIPEIKKLCSLSHNYGMEEAKRFGGKYIYFCPLGLTYFVSPIIGNNNNAAKITAGPILMVDRQDFITCDLRDNQHLSEETINSIKAELDKIQVVSPDKVSHLSNLLFMCVSFMNNVWESKQLIKTQDSDKNQSEVFSYIEQMKQSKKSVKYPFSTEHDLLRAIAHKNESEARRLLNELYGYIFFKQGGDLGRAKSRIYELLVLMSRTVIDVGAPPEESLELCHNMLDNFTKINNLNELCVWLTDAGNKFMNMAFNFEDVKHANAIHTTIQYVQHHYAEKITLESMSEKVFLSPSYFSRIFKNETGSNFREYLNKIRIEKSKDLLKHDFLRIADISAAVGFEDQSYYTKVFTKLAGLTPLAYRISLRKQS